MSRLPCDKKKKTYKCSIIRVKITFSLEPAHPKTCGVTNMFSLIVFESLRTIRLHPKNSSIQFFVFSPNEAGETTLDALIIDG